MSVIIAAAAVSLSILSVGFTIVARRYHKATEMFGRAQAMYTEASELRRSRERS